MYFECESLCEFSLREVLYKYIFAYFTYLICSAYLEAFCQEYSRLMFSVESGVTLLNGVAAHLMQLIALSGMASDI